VIASLAKRLENLFFAILTLPLVVAVISGEALAPGTTLVVAVTTGGPPPSSSLAWEALVRRVDGASLGG
jgi:hypothetical protein